MKKKKRFPLWQILVLLLCIPTFLISAFLFCRELLRYQAEDRAYTELSQNIQQAREYAELPERSKVSEPFPDKFAEYEILWEQNHDFAGWLFIENTKIDYPVMHTPNDPEYYLHRAFDGSDSRSGCLFADAACSIDGNSLLIYGHHMKDKSMFGSLTDYQSSDFAAEHPVIHFDTLTEERDYELLSAFYWDPSAAQEEDLFRYYEYTDLSSPDIFEKYIQKVKAYAIYDTGVISAYGDSILTLSTCSNRTSDGRFVVVAVSH